MQVVCLVGYERIRQIGVGQGMNSEVWLARDTQHDGIVAVKEIPKKKLRDAGVKNVFQEAQIMFAARHPQNVVPILYAGEIPNTDSIGLAMPYYQNGSLQDRLLTGPVTLLEAVRVGLAMLTGLSSLHAKDIRHFDLKPSNILFDNQDVPLVADFGQARAAATFGKVALPAMYSHGIPPEFFSTNVGGVATDIYHAGVTLYRAVNGHPFFAAQKIKDPAKLKTQVLAGKFPRRDRFLEHVPKAVRTLIRKAMSVNEADRFRSASDMWAALANCPITHNWTTKIGSDGECSWECPNRGSKTGFYVELSKSGQRWNVDALTVGSGRRRCKEKCLKGATRGDAERHLKTLFETLA
jgi:serine/threonine protein kinase